MNEAETRAEHIDPALAAAGWGVIEGICSIDMQTGKEKELLQYPTAGFTMKTTSTKLSK